MLQKPRSHSGDAFVDHAEKGIPALFAARFEDLKIPERHLVEDHEIGGFEIIDFGDVPGGGSLSFLGIFEARSGGADRGVFAAQAEA